MAGGMRGINPRQMKQAMRKMGITNREIEAIEVIIRTADKEIVISNPQVNVMSMQGQDNYQIVGEVSERAPGTGAPATTVPEEDIELVMSQTKCDRDTAIKALEDNGGQPAEAILQIMTQ